MKKLFLFCLIAATATTFLSCSKDDVSISKENLVGRWEIYKTTEYYPGDGLDVDEEYGEEYGYRQIWEFRSDGTLQGITMGYYNGKWSSHEKWCEYSLNGKTLKLSTDGEIESWTVEKLTPNELILKYVCEDGEIDKEYFKRI